MASKKGSFRLVFSTLRRRDLAWLLPGIVLAIAAGAIPPLMAKIIGSAFNAFTNLNPHSLPVDEIPHTVKDAFLRAILTAVWQLCVLAAGTMLLSTTMISIWVIVGEKVARGWRLFVYNEMAQRSMTWYDVDLKANAGQQQGEGGVGAGGLMAKFARETDDIRTATSQLMGQSIETLSTILASLCLAFLSCWSLTLVILASIPITTVVVGIIQKKAMPLHMVDMENMARAGKELQQTAEAIATVKALTMEERQERRFMGHIDRSIHAWNRLAVVYGARMGFTSTLTLVMFTSGFWYGSYLVQDGRASPGSILTTFWSCLLVGNAISTLLQRLQALEMGKVAAASLTKLVQQAEPKVPSTVVNVKWSAKSTLSFDSTHRLLPTQSRTSIKSLDSASLSAHTPTSSPVKSRFAQRPGHVIPMRKIWPHAPCQGEICMQGLSFSYPSRPQDAVLRNVSMFFPAGETTFIIGGSGSGKSTISHLLLGLYDDYAGSIQIDEQDVRYLDPVWSRAHIAAVEQNAIIFDMTVHDNIALGLCGGLHQDLSYKCNHVPRIPRKRVMEACRMVLLDKDIANMPNGYDTKLGAGGIDLSGGQKQRLALARAIIRNPTVLILDESTSALDVKSRLLVGEFIKAWRRGKTTLVITHDLKQIAQSDFVYMLEQGDLVEQGYRSALEERPESRFNALLASQTTAKSTSQSTTSEAVQEDVPSPTGLEWRASRALDKSFSQEQDRRRHARASLWASDFRFGSVNGYDDVYGGVEVMSRDSSIAQPYRMSDWRSTISRADTLETLQTCHTRPTHRRAASSISSASSSTSRGGLRPLRLAEARQEQVVRETGAKEPLELVSVAVSQRRPGQTLRKAWREEELERYAVDVNDGASYGQDEGDNGYIAEEQPDKGADAQKVAKEKLLMSTLLFRALRQTWTTSPRRLVLLLALLSTVIAASVQPTFSFVLGKLLATMGLMNQKHNVLVLSLVVLGLAFLDGAMQFLRFTLLQYSANVWIRSLRKEIIAKVLRQDKSWFDAEKNSSSALLIKLVKDGEDAKSFISRILGELVLVVTLISIAFLWSIVVSWQLTLAGVALAPLFYLVIAAQSKLIMRYERQNKLQRERVSKRFYNTVHNVRAIRAMGLEHVFRANFLDAVGWVEKHGVRSAPFSGFGYGLKDACTYLAEAVLYYIGALLILRGYLTLARMMIVFNLIVFSITYASQILAYLPNMSKAVQALDDLVSLLRIDDRSSSENTGRSQPHVQGAISFRNVHFHYPGRPEKKVLDGCTFDIGVGERVALVGQSGCGKSTVAALLQRLYEPTRGTIVLDGQWPLPSVSVHHLRQSLACVAQKSDLFDDTIRNNLLVANEAATPALLARALRIACCTDFVDKLDKGMETSVGDNADNLSGGQKQRIALARALLRTDAKIRILDECTSALDPTNQAHVAANLLDSAPHAYAPTTVVVTHKLEMMKRCDRILVLEQGRVVQSGTYEALLSQKGGAFSKLAHAGEWGA